MKRGLLIATSLITTVALVVALDTRLGVVPPLGRFLSPQHGFWQNAEAVKEQRSQVLQLTGLAKPVDVALDTNLVPHVFAANDADVYFAQGFLHAKYRLFQMDLQARLAAGRISEIVGPRALALDRQQRRIGMVYAAERSLQILERDSTIKAMFDAYTRGVNAYLESITQEDWPVEYKLLDITPESWTNLRSALTLKLMAKRLSSDNDQDIALTRALTTFPLRELDVLFPDVHDSLKPIVPQGTPFPPASVVPVAPATGGALPPSRPLSMAEIDPVDPNTGSNNWVVAGSRTQSGYPILCNDPHLELTLPSIWYQMQLATPTSSTYGVTLPGCPFVIIGFNDHVAWGVTNAQRDVKDYYSIRFKDASKQQYWYNGAWRATTRHIEQIMVRGQGATYDTVAYTAFGPVMYDASFGDTTVGREPLAVRWAGHDPSNEGRTFYMLNRARSHADYLQAISTFACPGQNFVFAAHTGDIAVWQQGRFPARWKGQGRVVMPGFDDSHAWQGFIPQRENPHAYNPARGYLHSANQRPADATYPYYASGGYITQRAAAIEDRLSVMHNVTPRDMMQMQNDVTNGTAVDVLPLLLRHVRRSRLRADAQRYLDIVSTWDRQASAASRGQTVFDRWMDSLQVALWADNMGQGPMALPWPSEQTTIEYLLRDTTMPYIDDVTTPERETLSDLVTTALQQAASSLRHDERGGRLAWGAWKNTSVYHLMKDAVPAFARTGLNIGGDRTMINAVGHSHGPSWRMVIHMQHPVEAYGIYPGGQSGNPGSPFYDNNVEAWARGRYNKLWLMKRSEISATPVRGIIRMEVVR
ncbi:MAG: penicillin acylase family protein [Candidatus Kapabacteria bacterium]|nr:penicillin acylase family protein [Candidatus Kapabacteria bacterium]